jgi:hypothetical protein
MAKRLVLMPVLPMVTVSEALNFRDNAGDPITDANDFECSHAAPTAPLATRTKKSRRLMTFLLT